MAAITPRYSVDNTQRSTNDTGGVFSGDLSGGAIIPAVNLPAGDYFVASAASFGASSAVATPEVACVYNRGAVGLGYARGEGFTTATPEAMRTSHLGAFQRLASNGTGDIEIWFRTVNSAHTAYMQGAAILAFRLDDPAAPLTEGVDFWHIEQTSDVTATDAYTTVLQLPATISEPGDYVLLVSTVGNGFSASVGQQRKCRVIVDAFTYKREWIKQVKDANDWHNPTQVSLISGVAAGAHTFTVQGGGTGAGTKLYRGTHIWLFRAAAFRSIVSSSLVTSYDIESEYSAWTTVNSAAFTNSGTENVIVLGNGAGRRPSLGSLAVRLRNSTTATVLHEFSSDANVSGIDQDETSHLVLGMESISAPTTYALDATGEAGVGTTGLVIYHPTVLVWSMTLAGASAPDFSETLTEGATVVGPDVLDVPMVTIGITESAVTVGPDSAHDPTSGPVTVNISEDAITVGPDVLVSTTTGEVPVQRPRFWFYNNTRLQYIRDEYDGGTLDERWTEFLHSVTQGRAHNAALKYAVTLDPADLTLALERIDAQLNAFADIGSVIRANGDTSGLYWCDMMRRLGYAWDWLEMVGADIGAARKERIKNIMLSTLHCVYTANYSTPHPLADGANNHWSTEAPTNNYYSRKLLGAGIVILTLFHENPTSFSYNQGASDPWTGGTSYNMTLPFGGTDYTDIFQWLQDKLNEQAIPVWRIHGEDGAWAEGTNYGAATVRHQQELLTFLRDSGAADFYSAMADHFKKVPLSHAYMRQPGSAFMIHDGDAAVNANMTATTYDKLGVMFSTDENVGSEESAYGQWIQENQFGFPETTDKEIRSWELILWRPRTATDIAGLTTHGYVGALGHVNMRTGWASGDTSVTIHSRNWERAGDGHTHEDQNGVQIFKGAWLLRDAYFNFSNGGNGPGNHQSYLLAGWGQAARSANTLDVTGAIRRHIGDSSYGYAQGDCGDAYYVKSSASHGATAITKINDIYWRELFYHKGLDFVVWYDRIRFMPAFASGPAVGYLNYPATLTDLGGGESRSVSGSYAIVRKFVTSVNNLSAGAYTNGYQESYELPLTSGYGRLMMAFQIGAAAIAGMDTHTQITSASGNMTGLHVAGSSEEFLVLFSTAQDADSASIVDYSYEESANPCINYVANLVPGGNYDILSSLAGSTRSITIIAGGAYSANSAGLLIFDGANLEDPPTVQTLTESPVSVGADTIGLSVTAAVTEAAVSVGPDVVTGLLIPEPANVETLTETAVTVGEDMGVLAVVPLTEDAVSVLADSLGETATVPITESAVTVGVDVVQSTLYGPTPDPDPDPDPETGETGRIDTIVEMDGGIDRGPTWQ